MDFINQDILLFFTQHQTVLPLYEAFAGKMATQFPDSYFVLTLGLPYPLESGRVAVKTEPYPGRWTTHIVISKMSDLDEELFAWVVQAYEFSEKK